MVAKHVFDADLALDSKKVQKGTICCECLALDECVFKDESDVQIDCRHEPVTLFVSRLDVISSCG